MKYYKQLFLAVTLVFSLGIIFSPQNSYASNGFFTNTNSGWTFDNGTSLLPSVSNTITSGRKVGEIYNPGDQFTLNSSAIAGMLNGGCNNQSVSAYVYIYSISTSSPKGPIVASASNSFGAYNSWNQTRVDISATSTFTVPSVPGQYRIYTYAGESNTHYYYQGTNLGYIDAYGNEVYRWDLVSSSNYSGSAGRGFYYEFTVAPSAPTPPSCGSAASVPSVSFPSSNLCGTGNTVSNQVTSTNNNPHTWTCSASGASVSCQAYRCASGNKYCSTTNACIANSACCGSGAGGSCLSSESCVVSAGYGSCVSGGSASSCSLPAITSTVTPAFVSDSSQKCILKWDVASTNTGGGSGSCTTNIKCYVDNIDKTTLNSSGVSIPVGTHSLVCGSSLGTSTASVKCKVTPGFGEF